MPNRDGTGPMGQGPMTGRGFGLCGRGSGMRRGRGFGRGFGMGRGFGWRGWTSDYPTYPVQPTPVQSVVYTQPQLTRGQELQYLETDRQAIEDEMAALKEDIKEILKRIEELKKKK